MRFVAMALLIAIVTGCARTDISGKTVAAPSSRIQSLALIFDDSVGFDPGSVSGGLTGAYRDIGARRAAENRDAFANAIESQFPRVFALNGIQLTVYKKSAGEDEFRRAAGQHRYVMHLIPTRATYNSYGSGSTLIMRAQVNEVRPSRNLWNGSVSLTRPGRATIDDGVAADFAEKVLQQLHADKLIELPSGSVKR